MEFKPGLKGNVILLRKLLRNALDPCLVDKMNPVFDTLEGQLNTATKAYVDLLRKNEQKTRRILELEGELAGLALAREQGLAEYLFPEEEGRS